MLAAPCFGFFRFTPTLVELDDFLTGLLDGRLVFRRDRGSALDETSIAFLQQGFGFRKSPLRREAGAQHALAVVSLPGIRISLLLSIQGLAQQRLGLAQQRFGLGVLLLLQTEPTQRCHDNRGERILGA